MVKVFLASFDLLFQPVDLECESLVEIVDLGGHCLLEVVDLVAVTLDHGGEILNLGGETLESVRQSLEPIISSRPIVSISTSTYGQTW